MSTDYRFANSSGSFQWDSESFRRALEDQSSGLGIKSVIISTGAKKVSGDKIAVVCNGQTFDFDTMEKAQQKAEELAHQCNANAYILKPIKKVSPKRDVITTDL